MKISKIKNYGTKNFLKKFFVNSLWETLSEPVRFFSSGSRGRWVATATRAFARGKRVVKLKALRRAYSPGICEKQIWDHSATNQNRGVKKKWLASAGFTLIETIIALSVITSAVVGPFSLATKGILNSSFAKNKIIASNLSQEGIELVRKIRENNILAGRGWDYGIASGSWQIDIFSSDLSLFSGIPMLFDSATGIYSQTNGSQTFFTRKITLTKPSANEVNIISEVNWMERSIERKIILSGKFYNWR